MKRHFRILLVAFLLLDSCFHCLGQSEKTTENDDEAKIIESWKTLFYRSTASRAITFKQRKFNSELFCDELIPCKNGFIINSVITSTGSHRKVEVTTSFYFIDLNTNKINEVIIPGVDTIESIISDEAGKLFCSIKRKGSNQIIAYKAGAEQDLLLSASHEIRQDLDTAKWLKLGYRNGSLFVLSPVSAYSFADNKWSLLTNYSFLQFFKKESKYYGRLNILPTKNIVVEGNSIWFLQEVVQERDCNLLRLDLNNGELKDFFISIGYTDSYHKEVNELLLLPDSSILVAASRLLDEQIVLKSSQAVTEVLIFKNAINTAAEKMGPAAVTTAELWRDTLYLAGTDGLFKKIGDTIVRLMSWENTHQNIKTKDGDFDFPFFPRAMRHLSDGRILIGGMWGGLYLADPRKNSILCLDDISDENIRKVNIHLL